MKLTRRHFLATSGAVTLAFGGLKSLLLESAWSDAIGVDAYGYGPLVSDSQEILDLPKGFTYKAISTIGQTMDDGLLVPGLHDGMAAFPGSDGQTVIVRNHEVNFDQKNQSAFGKNQEKLKLDQKDQFYDWGKGEMPGLGGTTTLVYDTRSGELVSHHLSLAGTCRNCAGGPTPWGSWITCEETVQRADGTIEKDHGYCFEVPADAKGLVPPVALKGMGRFNHEAIAVDPKSGIVYLTEDRGDGLLYRYIPVTPGQLAKGGRLQALVIRDRKSLDTSNHSKNPAVKPDETLAVQWIDMENTDAPEDDLRQRGFNEGAAQFSRGEGMWYGRDAVYFACTSGGRNQKGQIFRYVPSEYEGRPEEENKPGHLDLFVEPNDENALDNADNLTVSPWGDLIVCEDGPNEQYVVGITPKGKIYKVACNRSAEFAGATFSPDGSTLFVNIQGKGMTLAITGPWQKGA